MFSSPARSFIGAGKRLRVPLSARSLSSPSQPDAPAPQRASTPNPTSAPAAVTAPPVPEQPVEVESQVQEWSQRLGALGKDRLPRSVQALYLRPLRRKAEHGLPVCDLQLRSYSVQNVEFFADFAIRAAYYLNLPVSGPVPLPRIVERWTVPRSNFVHKKSQENFERITLRRLIQIKDGNSQAVEAWLAFLRKHAFYGVGMKANVYDHESLDVGKSMDQSAPETKDSLKPHFDLLGKRHGSYGKDLMDSLDRDRFGEQRHA